MRSTQAEREEVIAYFESQSAGDRVVHLDKLASERVGANLHDVWDAHSADRRWWVISTPLNLYTQEDFKSADVALTFHIGLMARVITRQDVPITADAAELLRESWRRWDRAVDTLSTASEAEDFQSVGMKLRECLISFANEIASDALVPVGSERPQQANVIGWAELLANELASGQSLRKLRSYLNVLSQESWETVNWLAHARNADPLDAEIGIAAVSHMLATFSAARLRWERQQGGGFPSSTVPIEDEEDLARRLADPCTPSSDVSTFITPEDFR